MFVATTNKRPSCTTSECAMPVSSLTQHERHVDRPLCERSVPGFAQGNRQEKETDRQESLPSGRFWDHASGLVWCRATHVSVGHLGSDSDAEKDIHDMRHWEPSARFFFGPARMLLFALFTVRGGDSREACDSREAREGLARRRGRRRAYAQMQALDGRVEAAPSGFEDVVAVFIQVAVRPLAD
eukprot:1436215-Rhodomonas_salina.1